MNKALKIVLAILIVVILAGGGYAWYVISSMTGDAVPIVEKPAELPADDNATPSPVPEVITLGGDATQAPIYEETQIDEGVFNILLVGADSRSGDIGAGGLSDSIVLVSYDRATGKITLVSFMRDACVKRIGQRSYFDGKLNAAFKNGGVGELINTLNYNFKLDVQNYVTVSYEGFTALVDEIGGIDVPLTSEEAYYINWRSADIPQDYFTDQARRVEILQSLGRPVLEEGYEGTKVQHLGGYQALWFSRDRTSHTADGGTGSDLTRISKQQLALQLIFDKVQSEMSFGKVLALINFATKYVDTNLSVEEMSTLAGKLLEDDINFVTARVPFDDTYHYGKAGNGEDASMVYFNIEKAAEQLLALLYGA